MSTNYSFFENKDCEYYPCHPTLNEINCLFCYCPLYKNEFCPGNCSYADNGIKECNGCNFPHIKENYNKVIHEVVNNICR